MTGQMKVQWMQKLVSQKSQEPPKSFEEFLKSQNWDYWPRDVPFINSGIWEDALKKIEEDISFASIYSYLWTNVPRTFEALSTMETRLKECSHLLQQHSSNLFENDIMISTKSKGSYANLERYKAFLKEHYRQKRIMLSDEMETEKNIEGCNFSGFKEYEITHLPRHLDAKQIYLFVLRTHNFEEKIFKIWKTHILSDSSIALLHDSFWWWFLHKFKPDRRDQDCLFDRMSENYAKLFLRIPLKNIDSFFQMYPDCLAQAVYATFQESFPESSNVFNNEFKEDLGNTIFLWLSGIDFNIESILKNPKAHVASVLKEESTTVSRATTKSHYASFGPEFHRVLFDFGGQSPLILNYLKLHETGGLAVTHKKREVDSPRYSRRHTPPAPTYCDIIKEAKRKFAKNQKDFRRAKQRIKEDIKFLKEQQEKVDKELDRLQAKASRNIQEVKNDFDKFLHTLRVEAKLREEYTGSSTLPSSESSPLPQSPQHSSSLSSSTATPRSEGLSHLDEGGLREGSQQ